MEEIAAVDREHPDRLVAWDDRFFLRHDGAKDGRARFRGIEATTGATFHVPDGATVDFTEPADTRWSEATIGRALSLLEERGTASFDPAIAERVATKTGLSTTAATLLWSAGYDPWLIGDKKCEAFGIAPRALDGAEKELRKVVIRRAFAGHVGPGGVYARAMPDDPAEMYDGQAMAERLIAALA
jgi:hypothetical protein